MRTSNARTSHQHGAAAARLVRCRSIRLAAACAVALTACSFAAAPASARIRDSVWLTATPTLTAQTNLAMDLNRFIYMYDVQGVDTKVCQAVTTCTMTVTLPTTTVATRTYIAEVRQFGLFGFDQPYHPNDGERTIATSNAVTITFNPA